jgi:hypothetical protein
VSLMSTIPTHKCGGLSPALMSFSLSSRGTRAFGQGVDGHQRCARHDTLSCFLSGSPCRSPLKALSGYRSVR